MTLPAEHAAPPRARPTPARLAHARVARAPLVPRRCVASTLLLGLVAVACGGEDGAASATTTTRDSAGITFITSDATDRAFPDSLRDLATLGPATGHLFDELASQRVATDGTDRIAVLDATDKRVLVLTIGDDARVVRTDTLGGPGGGPGEFQFPGAVRFTPEGAIDVHDWSKTARVRFARDGTVLPELARRTPLGTLEDDALLTADGFTGVLTEAADSADARTLRLVHATATDTVTLRTVTQPVVRDLAFESCPIRMAMMPRLHTPELRWRSRDAQFVVSAEPAYRLEWYEQGALRAVWERARPPETSAPEDVARLLPDGLGISIPGGPSCRVPTDEIARLWGLAPQRPQIDGLIVAPDGSVWVKPFTFDDEPPRVDVFGADGRYRGTIADLPLPVGFLSDNRVVVLDSDPTTDEPVIRILRVQP